MMTEDKSYVDAASHQPSPRSSKNWHYQSALVFKYSKLEIRREKDRYKVLKLSEDEMEERNLSSFAPSTINPIKFETQKKSTNSPEGGDRDLPQRLHCTEETLSLTEIWYFDTVNAFKILKNEDRREREVRRSKR